MKLTVANTNVVKQAASSALHWGVVLESVHGLQSYVYTFTSVHHLAVRGL